MNIFYKSHVLFSLRFISHLNGHHPKDHIEQAKKDWHEQYGQIIQFITPVHLICVVDFHRSRQEEAHIDAVSDFTCKRYSGVVVGNAHKP